MRPKMLAQENAAPTQVADTQSPKVSVIVPCYNYGRYLGRALRSIQAQRFQDWECIVIDDGSSDDTRSVAGTFGGDHRIRYHYQDNAGLSAARNAGLALARGTYIQFLDADDILWKEKLGPHSTYLDRRDDADILYGQYATLTDAEVAGLLADGNDVPISVNDSVLMPGDPFDSFLHRWEKGFSIPIHCYMFRRRCFEWGVFDQALPTHEDVDLALRFALNGAQFHMTSGETVIYCKHGASMVLNLTRMHQGYLRMLAKLFRDPLAKGKSIGIAHRYFQEFSNAVRDKLRSRRVKFREAVVSPGTRTLNVFAVLLLPLYMASRGARKAGLR